MLNEHCVPVPDLDANGLAIRINEARVAKAQRLEAPISDTFRRIRNILDVCPQSDWTPDEAKVVLAALSSILRGRQGAAATLGPVS